MSTLIIKSIIFIIFLVFLDKFIFVGNLLQLFLADESLYVFYDLSEAVHFLPHTMHFYLLGHVIFYTIAIVLFLYLYMFFNIQILIFSIVGVVAIQFNLLQSDVSISFQEATPENLSILIYPLISAIFLIFLSLLFIRFKKQVSKVMHSFFGKFDNFILFVIEYIIICLPFVSISMVFMIVIIFTPSILQEQMQQIGINKEIITSFQIIIALIATRYTIYNRYKEGKDVGLEYDV